VRRLRLELQAIAQGQADIVIGTQLVAKGHNFPGMTLVGVVDADLGLANGDPRAAERTFQLLSQVTGRAGRTGLKSRGLIQTFQPDHPVMRALLSGDAESFYSREIAERERGAMPPFGRLAALVVSAARAARPRRMAARCGGPRPNPRRSGCSAPPRRRWRWWRAAIASAARPGQAFGGHAGFLRRLLNDAPPPRGSVRVAVDVDPQSFL
jgi:primosomal protein N' (replication factor Y)